MTMEERLQQIDRYIESRVGQHNHAGVVVLDLDDAQWLMLLAREAQLNRDYFAQYCNEDGCTASCDDPVGSHSEECTIHHNLNKLLSMTKETRKQEAKEGKKK